MDYLKLYFSELRINLDPLKLEYLTVVPKDIQNMISKYFEKDAIVHEFIDHLIDSYLINVSYDYEFLNIEVFKSKIIKLLQNEFGNPFDFSKHKDMLNKKFFELYGSREPTDDLFLKFSNEIDIILECVKTHNLTWEIGNLFEPKLGYKLDWNRFYFNQIENDVAYFIINNLLAENFELIEYVNYQYSDTSH